MFGYPDLVYFGKCWCFVQLDPSNYDSSTNLYNWQQSLHNLDLSDFSFINNNDVFHNDTLWLCKLFSLSNLSFLFHLYYSVSVDLSGVIDTSLTPSTKSKENSTSILKSNPKIFLGKTYVNLYGLSNSQLTLSKNVSWNNEF